MVSQIKENIHSQFACELVLKRVELESVSFFSWHFKTKSVFWWSYNQNITIFELVNLWPHRYSVYRLCVVLSTFQRKKWTFYVIQKLSRFKIEWHFFPSHFGVSFVHSLTSHIVHRIASCVCVSAEWSLSLSAASIWILFYDQTYFISNWLYTSNTSCFVVGVVNRHRVILLPRQTHTQRDKERETKNPEWKK